VTTHTPAHADDAGFTRLLDGEAADAERRAIEQHVGECARCASRLAELRGRSAALRAMLAAAPAASPPPSLTWERVAARAARSSHPSRATRAGDRPVARRLWRGARPWRIAAAVLLFASGVALAAPGMRGWVRRAVAPAPRPVVATSVAHGEAATPAAPARSRVSFDVGREVTIAFDARPAAGTLELLPGAAGTSVEVEVIGADAADARLVVLPGGGLRVHNTAASTQSYRVRVPATVSRLTLRVGGESRTLPGGAALAATPVVVALGSRQEH
jgi:anti-sigma factor RsiW